MSRNKKSIFQIVMYLTTVLIELKKWLFEFGGTLDVVRGSTAMDAAKRGRRIEMRYN